MAEISSPTDLFGLPQVEPKETRGRKAHQRNAEVAKKIAVSRATGATEQECADIVGLSVPTLRKYYFRELDKGTKLVRALLNEAVFKAAVIEGKASAQRLLDKFLERGDAAVPMATRVAPTKAKPAAAAKAKPLGKKAQAALDALTAEEGNEWGNLLN